MQSTTSILVCRPRCLWNWFQLCFWWKTRLPILDSEVPRCRVPVVNTHIVRNVSCCADGVCSYSCAVCAAVAPTLFNSTPHATVWTLTIARVIASHKKIVGWPPNVFQCVINDKKFGIKIPMKRICDVLKITEELINHEAIKMERVEKCGAFDVFAE